MTRVLLHAVPVFAAAVLVLDVVGVAVGRVLRRRRGAEGERR